MDLRYYHWIIKAKREGICVETGNPIKEGDQVMYIKGVKGVSKASIFCQESNFYKENEKSIRTGWKI